MENGLAWIFLHDTIMQLNKTSWSNELRRQLGIQDWIERVFWE